MARTTRPISRDYANLCSMAMDFTALHDVLARVEALADSSPDWNCKHLADLLGEFRPMLSTAALHSDQAAWGQALTGLMLMLRRYLLSTSL